MTNILTVLTCAALLLLIVARNPVEAAMVTICLSLSLSLNDCLGDEPDEPDEPTTTTAAPCVDLVASDSDFCQQSYACDVLPDYCLKSCGLC